MVTVKTSENRRLLIGVDKNTIVQRAILSTKPVKKLFPCNSFGHIVNFTFNPWTITSAVRKLFTYHIM